MASRYVIWRYYAFRATNAYGFYLPFSIIYLQQERGFGLAVIGLIQAAFLMTMVAGEVPAGYVGDRIGRRASLALGNACVVVAMGAYVLVSSPLAYVALNAVWALGWTFQSGTRGAWLYEFLEASGDESEYARISGRGSTVQLVVSAASAVVAGWLYTLDTSLPFVANSGLVALGIPLLATLPTVEQATDESFQIRDALRVLRLQAARPELRWLVVYAALFNGLFSVTRWLEQPAMASVDVPVAGFGLLYAGFKLVSAGAAATAGWFEEALGPRRVFVLLAPVYGLAYASIGLLPVLVVPVLFLNRGLATVTRPIRNQYLNDHIEDVGRATVLSGASMVLSLASAGANVVGGRLAEATGPTEFLPWAGIAVAGVGAVLWLATSPVQPTVEDGTGSGVPSTD